MARIIIDYPDDMKQVNALRFIVALAFEGRLCDAGDIPRTPWVATFGKPPQVQVVMRRKKHGQTTDSLLITRVKEQE